MSQTCNSRAAELRRDLLASGIITAVWIAMVAVVNPSGEFPLNDDWCYALSVKALVQDGTYRLVSIVPMTLLVQVLWGSLFCMPFGFSFTALRVSSLVAGLGGVIALYFLLRELGADRRISLIGALMVAVNPIYFALANTFMTDVPFFALSVLSIYAFVRSLKRESNAAFVTAAVLGCLTILLRQAGVVIPLAFGIAILVRDGLRARNVLKAGLPTLVGCVLLFVYQTWLSATGRLPEFYGLQIRNAMDFFSHGAETFTALYSTVLRACAYLGLFVFPLLLAGFSVKMRSPARLRTLAGTAFAALVIYVLIRPIGWMGGMPLSEGIGHVLIPQGIGPHTLPDIVRAQLSNVAPLPRIFWLIVTWISVVGASMLVIELLTCAQALPRKSDRPRTHRSLVAMMLAGLVLCLAPIVMLFFFAVFDRYFLPAIVFVAGAIVLAQYAPVKPGRVITVTVALMLVLAGALSVGLTHDYLAWNRARWSALNDLSAEGVSPPEIDGGYEFNGLCNVDPQHGGDWSNPFLEKNEVLYAITFGPYPDYELVRAYPYQNWILPRQGKVFLMRRSW